MPPVTISGLNQTQITELKFIANKPEPAVTLIFNTIFVDWCCNLEIYRLAHIWNIGSKHKIESKWILANSKCLIKQYTASFQMIHAFNWQVFETPKNKVTGWCTVLLRRTNNRTTVKPGSFPNTDGSKSDTEISPQGLGYTKPSHYLVISSFFHSFQTLTFKSWFIPLFLKILYKSHDLEWFKKCSCN